jgi:hypothetical protein
MPYVLSHMGNLELNKENLNAGYGENIKQKERVR